MGRTGSLKTGRKLAGKEAFRTGREWAGKEAFRTGRKMGRTGRL